MLLSLLSLLSFEFFVILTNSIELVQHTCIHHELQHDIQPIDIPLSHQAEGRILQDAYQNIRIHFDLTHLKKLPPEFLNYMTKSVIPPAKNYLEKTLKVIPNARNLSLSNFSTICANNVTVPSLYHKEGVDADLVLFVQIVDEPTKEFIAFASPCIVNRLTKRPLVGRLVYNTALFQPSDIDVKIERDLIVTLHEITHVLGFSSAHFSSFINPATNVILTDHISTKEINGKSTTVLNVEPLTNRLKEHFGCSDVDGAYLEDEGGPGSAGQHFERRIFYNEYMTASPLKDARISEFTLALLEGSGWYQVDYSMAEKLIWGKNKGCGFIDGPCLNKQTGEPNFEEFCSPLGKPGYSWTRRGAGACGTSEPKINPNLTNKFDYWKNKTIVNDQFLDNCPAFFMFSNFDCEDVTNLNKASLGNYEFYGYGSKNFMGTLSRTKELSSPYWYCFKPICDLQPSGDYRLKVNIGLSIVTCEKQEDISVPGLVGALFCPDPNEYCTRIESEGFCRRGCSGRGECIDKKCQCEDGWTHHDCSQKIHVDNCTRCEGKELLMNSCYGDKCVCNPQTSNCRDAIIEELLRTARARINKKDQKSRRLKPKNQKRRKLN